MDRKEASDLPLPSPVDDRHMFRGALFTGRSRRCRAAVFLLLAIHASLLAWSAMRHSPNANEPAHLAAGIHHWQFGRFELYRVNPPLVRMLAALPVLFAGCETDWSNAYVLRRGRQEFVVGPDFVAANGERSLWLFTLARWACIPFSLVGGLVCFLWGRDLYDMRAGLLSVTLWCFSPCILGHASCITPDAHATSVGLAANYLFWRWLRQPTSGRAAASGFLLGLALLTKTTWVCLLVLWPMIWIVWRVLGRRAGKDHVVPLFRDFLYLILTILLGLHVLNQGYMYDGTFRRLGEFQFVSRTLGGKSDGEEGNRFRDTPLAALPMPLPAQYLLGDDEQKAEFERHPVSYFRGQMYSHGFWYYYLYAAAVKVPLGTLLLAVLTLLHCLRQWCPRQVCPPRLEPPPISWLDGFVLLTPLVSLLLLISSETDYSAHFRYALPMLPYAFIWIGQIAKMVKMEDLTIFRARRMGHLSYATAVLLGLSWSVVSCLSAAPHWLSYFNEAVGGPLRGDEHLINSNIDWGQDLLYLREWLAEHPEAVPIGLAYYGMFHPRAVGMEFQDVPRFIADPSELKQTAADGLSLNPQPGWYAVSVNFVAGHPFWISRSDGSRGWLSKPYFAYFRKFQPIARAGYSINVYHLTEEDIRHLQDR